MSGIQAESLTARLPGRGEIGRQRGFGAGGIFAGVGLGIKLHPVGAAGLRPATIAGSGSTKPRTRMPFSWNRAVTSVRNPRLASVSPTGIRRNGVMGVGHEGHLRRHHLQHQIDEARNRIALDIEFGGEDPFQVPHVVVADVAGVGTRMDRDAFRAGNARYRGPHGPRREDFCRANCAPRQSY